MPSRPSHRRITRAQVRAASLTMAMLVPLFGSRGYREAGHDVVCRNVDRSAQAARVPEAPARQGPAVAADRGSEARTSDRPSWLRVILPTPPAAVGSPPQRLCARRQ